MDVLPMLTPCCGEREEKGFSSSYFLQYYYLKFDFHPTTQIEGRFIIRFIK
jgi:hypothetical protein